MIMLAVFQPFSCALLVRAAEVTQAPKRFKTVGTSCCRTAVRERATRTSEWITRDPLGQT
jgi:hypothetical protein